MDNKGQIPFVQNQSQNNNTQPVPSTQSQSLQQNLNNTQIPQPINPPDKKTKQQVSVSGHPEQGSSAIDMDEDDKDDRIQAAKQEVVKKETPMPVVPIANKEIDVRDELRNAGVSAAPDADTTQLPEESIQLGDAPVQNQQPVASQQNNTGLPMTYGEAQLAVKKERSIRNGISWIVRQIKRQWKMLKEKSES